MRFMVMVKATKESEAGVMPSEELLTEMGKYNEELVKAGVMLAGEGLHPSSKGARVRFSGKRPHRDRRALRRDEGAGRRLLADAGEVDGRGDRVGQALPQPDERGVRDRDSPGVRGGGLRRRVHARAQGAGGSACGRRWRRTSRQRDAARRHEPHDRGGLADRVGAADRRSRADRARRRPGRGARAGCARRRARAVAGVGRPGQPGRLAHGHREASCDRPDSPGQAARAQAGGARSRPRHPAGDRPRRISPPRSTTTSATTSCAWCSRPAIRCSPPRRALRSRSGCSAV